MYDIYCLSLLFSVLGVYYLNKKNRVIAIILFVLSIGLYQSYIQVATGLLFLLVLKQLLSNDDSNVFKDLFKQLLIVGVAIIIYFICAILASKITGVDLSSTSNSITSILEKNPLTIIINLIKLFGAFGYYIIYPYTFHPFISGCLNTSLFLICVYQFLINIKDYNKTRSIKIILLVVLYPLAVTFLYIVANQTFHNLLTYSFSLFYLLILVYLESLNNIPRKLNYAIKIMFIILCLNNFLYSNNIYHRKIFEAKKTDLIMNQMILDIYGHEDYVKDKTIVVLIGNANGSPLFLKPLSYYEDNRKLSTVGLFSHSSITYSYSFYINTQLGYDMKIENISEEMKNNSIIKEMPLYPSKGSIKMIDGKLYVKVSNDY